MAYLFKVSEAKKADEGEIIKSLSKLSDILVERKINDVTFDIDEVYQSLLSQDCFNDPKTIKDIFIINNAMIGIPAVPPQNNGRGERMNGSHVIPVIEVPGMSTPYQAYIEGTETWVDSASVNLRGPRRIHVHKVIPGMVVSFHHYNTRDGMSNRESIDVFKVMYDNEQNIVVKPLGEHEATFNLPDEDKIPKREGF